MSYYPIYKIEYILLMDNSPSPPSVLIIVELGPELMSLADCDETLRPFLQENVETNLAGVFAGLGLPGKSVVELGPSPLNEGLRIIIKGVSLRYPQALIRNTWEYLSSLTCGTLPLSYSWQDWVNENLSAVKTIEGEHLKRIKEFLVLLIVEIIKLQPEHRLREVVAQTWVSILAGTSERQRLRMTGAIIEEDIAETVVRRPAAIEIHMHPDYLVHLFNVKATSSSLDAPEIDDRIRAEFGVLARRLFSELGIRVPAIKLIASNNLKDNAFAAKMNGLVGMPSIGLRPSEVLVNTTPERLERLGIKALHSSNPRTNETSCIIAKENLKKLEGQEFGAWDCVGYIVLALRRQLKRNAWRFIDTEVVEYELASMHQSCPELVLAALERFSIEHLTRVLRKLLREEVSVRDLKTILERMLTYDSIVFDSHGYIIFDDRRVIHERLNIGPQDSIENHTEHVRVGLRDYFYHKYFCGPHTLLVLDRDQIEAKLIEHLAAERGDVSASALTQDGIEKILVAVRRELDGRMHTIRCIIVTDSAIRAFFHMLIAQEFPDVPVISHEELSPDIKNEPFVKIVPTELIPQDATGS